MATIADVMLTACENVDIEAFDRLLDPRLDGIVIIYGISTIQASRQLKSLRDLLLNAAH